MRLRITANFTSLMKESGWVPKALLNFEQIVGVEEYFIFYYVVPTEESPLCHLLLAFFVRLFRKPGPNAVLKSGP